MVFLLIWAACAVGGYFIGKDKGRAGEGLAWGLLLGVIGLIIIACRGPVDPTTRVPDVQGPFSSQHQMGRHS